METSLHRQLKAIYAKEDARTEVPVGRYRIDAVVDDLLIEVQHASLASIRDKVRDLLREHRVLIVKPIIAQKQLVKRARKPVLQRCLVDAFESRRFHDGGTHESAIVKHRYGRDPATHRRS